MEHTLKQYLLHQKRLIVGIFYACLAMTHLYASVVLSGPSAIPTETTPFPLLRHAYNLTSLSGYSSSSLIWFVGARTPPDQNSSIFGISGLRSLQEKLTPLITTNASVRFGQQHMSSQPNPLYGQSIALLDTLGINPVVVTATDPKTLYVLNGASISKDNKSSILYAIQPTTEASSIIALSAFQSDRIDRDGTLTGQMGIVYVTEPAGGLFGSSPSTIGIAVFALLQKENAASGDPGILALGNINPYILSANLQLFQIGTPITGLGTNPVVTTSNHMNKAYIGCQAQGGPASTDGVNCVMVVDTTMRAETNPTVATPEPVVNASFVSGNNIVAAIGSSIDLAITGLRTIRTSTGLSYLIVKGGIASDPDAQASLYALPILHGSGTAASISQPPVTLYETRNNISFAANRIFQSPPINNNDIYFNTSIPAQVGGGPLHAPITDFVVAGDALFAATATINNGQAPGLWHSQALLSPTGTIVRWTPWKRAGGAAAAIPVYGFSYDQYKGVFLIISGTDPNNTNTVLTSNWTDKSPLTALATAYGAPGKGGIQGITDYARNTNLYPALTLFTGYHTVLITQTDEIIAPPATPDAYITPRQSYTQGFQSLDGSFTTFDATNNYSWLACSGGDLDRLGALMSATIASDATQSWFVVAGSNGIGVLSAPDGTGWTTTTGLGEQFANLSASMSWKQLQITYQGQPLSGIRTLVSDRNQLYILANSGLYRINPNQSLFSGSTSGETIALSLASDFNNSIIGEHTACFIKDSLALVATSIGLFRNGNGTRIDTALTPEDLSWQAVDLPYSPGPVASLYTIGPVDHITNSGYDANIWVLTNAVSLHQAKVFRLSVQYENEVNDSSIQLFPDEIIAHNNAYFLSCSHYRNSIATDGALLALSRSRYRNSPAISRIYTPAWYRWPYNNFTTNLQIEESGFPLLTMIPEASRITAHGLVRCSASGAWFAPGNFGVISNE